MKVMYCHGRGSDGNGTKAQQLKGQFGAENVFANNYPTNDPIGENAEMLVPLAEMSNFWQYVEMLKKDIAEQNPEVIVASSFGGAVTCQVIKEGAWTGPTVFLAQAGVKFGVVSALPEGTRAVFIHGKNDDIVAIEGSKRLAKSSSRATLITVEDGHRLHLPESTNAFLAATAAYL